MQGFIERVHGAFNNPDGLYIVGMNELYRIGVLEPNHDGKNGTRLGHNGVGKFKDTMQVSGVVGLLAGQYSKDYAGFVDAFNKRFE